MRARWAGTAAFAGLTLIVTTAGCSGDGRPKAEAPPSIPPPPIATIPAPASADGLSLPLEAYLLTPEQNATVHRAQSMLTADCMRRYGFSYPVAGARGLSAARETVNWLFLSERTAAQWGYHQSPERRAEIQRAQEGGNGTDLSGAAKAVMTGTAASYQGTAVPKGGCFSQGRDGIEAGAGKIKLPTWADRGDQKLPPGAPPSMRLASEQPSYLPETLLDGAFKYAQADARMKKVEAAWSTCMNEAGHAYPNVDAVLRDRRWEGGEGPSTAEIATARADARCRARVNYAGTMYALQVAYQEALIEQNAEALVQVRRTNETMVRNAAEVLNGGSTS
ncbi:hypothetical protein [Actinomadura rudentiformis]|uniref:Lipoprotein n=1 Tax=Actinomadura rudentiformis TaxID=359158 RepID=A0A6H9Z499_9ACTN|nr:hypothetical protein [Actinomadura rudentiformis]KAB2350761.1 hypothetical protein F8566_07200 [Actinomadura rudentiformis]